LKIEDFQNGEKKWTCVCGFVKEGELNLEFSEISAEKEKLGEKVSPEYEPPGFPHICKKCGHGESIVTDLGCQISDESNIYTYKCKKCSHLERQADGSGNK